MSVKWRGDEFMQRLRKHAGDNLERAAKHYQNRVKDAVNRPGRIQTASRGRREIGSQRRRARKRFRDAIKGAAAQSRLRRAKLRFGSGKTRRVLGVTLASRPGEPPRAQTGNLRRSISRELDRGTLAARVGTNVKYALVLERGRAGGQTIAPRRKRVLANVETGEFFGKRVKLGAMKPRPFFGPTLQRERGAITRLLTAPMA